LRLADIFEQQNKINTNNSNQCAKLTITEMVQEEKRPKNK